MKKKSAIHRMMDYIAMRDHSQKELITKLKRFHTTEEIQKAITYGIDQGWIPQNPDQLQSLSNKVGSTLQRKGKGPVYINQYLAKKGLPPITVNADESLEIAYKLLEKKFKNVEKPINFRNKASLFLKSKGFTLHTIRAAVVNFEKNSGTDNT